MKRSRSMISFSDYFCILLCQMEAKIDCYHERQRLQLCALHSLNNLFQRPLFDKKKLDSIVKKYDRSMFWNEYSSFYTGNYDLAIILEALQCENHTLKAISNDEPLEQFNYEECLGILLNISIEGMLRNVLPFIDYFSKPGRHWLVLKTFDKKQFYNLDSKLSRPKLIGDRTELIKHLQNYREQGSYIYLVINADIAKQFEHSPFN